MNVKAMSIRGQFLFNSAIQGLWKKYPSGKRTLTLVTVSALLFLVGLVCVCGKEKTAVWASFNVSN